MNSVENACHPTVVSGTIDASFEAEGAPEPPLCTLLLQITGTKTFEYAHIRP
jgi:hypothetical protein